MRHPVAAAVVVAVLALAPDGPAAAGVLEDPRWLGGLDLVGGIASGQAPRTEETRQPPRPDISPLQRDYLLGFPRAAWRMATQPARWEGNDWLLAGAVGAGIGGLVLLDDNIQAWSQGWRNGDTESVAAVFEPFGDGKKLAAGTVATYFVGEITGRPDLQRAGLNAFQALVTGGLLSEGIKRAVGRTRPRYTTDSTEFQPPTSDNEHMAFPSGHATAAFSVATVVAEEWKRKLPWVPFVSYGIATGTALSRMHDNKHWASDVVAGALLGIGTGLIVSRLSPFREGLEVEPVISAEKLGLRLTLGL